MERKKISLWQLFLIFLKINTFTFGGGYTIIAVIRDEFVIKRKLIDDNEILNLMAIAQSGPGALAINASILTGFSLKGLSGALAATLASVLPCLVIITLISVFYQIFKTNRYVAAALTGMSGAISAVLIITTYKLAVQAFKIDRWISLAIMISSFLLSAYTNLHTGLIIGGLALFGLFYYGGWKELKR